MKYSEVRDYEVSTTSQWYATFKTHTELNKIGTNYAPIIDFDYEINYQEIEVDVGATGLTLMSLKNKNVINELSLTFVETDDFFYQNYFIEYLDKFQLTKGKSLNFKNIDKKSIKLDIVYTSKTGEEIFKDSFGIIPNSIGYKGDVSYGLNTFTQTFIVTSYTRTKLK